MKKGTRLSTLEKRLIERMRRCYSFEGKWCGEKIMNDNDEKRGEKVCLSSSIYLNVNYFLLITKLIHACFEEVLFEV